MISKYVNLALIFESEFKYTFDTNESLILQYNDCYALKLCIDGVNTENEKWLDIMQTLYTKLNRVIESLASELDITTDLAYKQLVDYLVSNKYF